MRLKRLVTVFFVLSFTGSAVFAQAPGDVPAYHPAPPAKGANLAAPLSGAQLQTPVFRYAFQRHAYELAAKIQSVLYQLPCYCYCDRSAGHKSLQSCFTTEHGAQCSTCMQEAYYAYKMTKQGWTVKQIRAGIMHGEAQHIDLQNAVNMD